MRAASVVLRLVLAFVVGFVLGGLFA